MSAEIIRHPSMRELQNGEAKAAWYRKYYGGAHFPDMRSVEQYRMGEWIALQVSWLRRGYRFMDKPKPIRHASRATVFFNKLRKNRGRQATG